MEYNSSNFCPFDLQKLVEEHIGCISMLTENGNLFSETFVETAKGITSLLTFNNKLASIEIFGTPSRIVRQACTEQIGIDFLCIIAKEVNRHVKSLKANVTASTFLYEFYYLHCAQVNNVMGVKGVSITVFFELKKRSKPFLIY
jgi:hypothetical protein